MCVKARPSVASAPLYFVVKARANMQAMVNSAQRTRNSVSSELAARNAAAPIRSQKAESTAARKMPVPVAESQLNS